MVLQIFGGTQPQKGWVEGQFEMRLFTWATRLAFLLQFPFNLTSLLFPALANVSVCPLFVNSIGTKHSKFPNILSKHSRVALF